MGVRYKKIPEKNSYKKEKAGIFLPAFMFEVVVLFSWLAMRVLFVVFEAYLYETIYHQIMNYVGYFVIAYTVFLVVMVFYRIRERTMKWQVERAFLNSSTVNRMAYTEYIEVPNIRVKKKENQFVMEIEQLAGMPDAQENVKTINVALKGINRNYLVKNVVIDNSQTKAEYMLYDVSKVKRIAMARDSDFFEIEPEESTELKLMDGVYWDLVSTPHLLVAGGTGSGKTTFLFGLLAQIFQTKSIVKMIDPKSEFYFEMKSYLKGNIAEPSNEKDIMRVIDETLKEMLRREKLIGQTSGFGITGKDIELEPLFLIIDEVASVVQLMDKKVSKEFTDKLKTIVMRGRSSLVNVVLMTQQPNATVIETSIRDNISLKVLLGSSSPEMSRMMFGEDSKVILRKVPKFQGYYEMQGITNGPEIIKVFDLQGLKKGNNLERLLRESYLEKRT